MSPMSAPAAKNPFRSEDQNALDLWIFIKASAAAAILDINSGLSTFNTLRRCNCNTPTGPSFFTISGSVLASVMPQRIRSRRFVFDFGISRFADSGVCHLVPLGLAIGVPGGGPPSPSA